MKRSIVRAIAIALTTVAITACADSTSPEPIADLQQTRWALESVTTASGTSDIHELGLEAHIEFGPIAGGLLEVGGRATCNHFSGHATIDGSVLKFSDVFSTLIGCGEPAASVEQSIFEVLRATATAQLDGNSLTLQAEEGSLELSRVTETGR